MAGEALNALERFEERYEVPDVFERLRAVGFVCLDGEKLISSLRDEVRPRDQLAFQRAAIYLARVSSLHSGGASNPEVHGAVQLIKSTVERLAAGPVSGAAPIVFYSWQSQLPNKTNRGLIQDSIELALKQVGADLPIESRPQIDSDTAGVPGSPDIIHTILSKVDAAAVFVADVSFTTDLQPNANVMFELGYAMKVLGSRRVLMVFNTAFGDARDLPFDLGFKRQILFKNAPEAEDRASARKDLAAKLKVGIQEILKP